MALNSLLTLAPQVDELKAELKKRELDTRGRKAELQERLREALREAGEDGEEEVEEEVEEDEDEESSGDDFVTKLWNLKDLIIDCLTTAEMKTVLQKNGQVLPTSFCDTTIKLTAWLQSMIKVAQLIWLTVSQKACSKALFLRYDYHLTCGQ